MLNRYSLKNDPGSVLRSFGYTFIFNTLIAVLLTVVGFGEGFWSTFLVAQSIGLTIGCSVHAALFAFKPEKPWALHLTILTSVILGAIVGTALGGAITDIPIWITPEGLGLMWRVVFISLLFGLAASYLFTLNKIAQGERIQRLTAEKEAAETRLRLLQARIEPHFLFNTLSNILSLMESDSARAQIMMMDFIEYLRNSLSTTRESSIPLAREMETIEAYLRLFKVRMGERLRYRIDLPEELRNAVIAPMLLQPLVENALKHGLEPLVEGGEIVVSARAADGVLRLEVADTGGGLKNSRPGLGINNVRERLDSLYGDQGRLLFEENKPRGVIAIIEVPL